MIRVTCVAEVLAKQCRNDDFCHFDSCPINAGRCATVSVNDWISYLTTPDHARCIDCIHFNALWRSNTDTLMRNVCRWHKKMHVIEEPEDIRQCDNFMHKGTGTSL